MIQLQALLISQLAARLDITNLCTSVTPRHVVAFEAGNDTRKRWHFLLFLFLFTVCLFSFAMMLYPHTYPIDPSTYRSQALPCLLASLRVGLR